MSYSCSSFSVIVLPDDILLNVGHGLNSYLKLLIASPDITQLPKYNPPFEMMSSKVGNPANSFSLLLLIITSNLSLASSNGLCRDIILRYISRNCLLSHSHFKDSIMIFVPVSFSAKCSGKIFRLIFTGKLLIDFAFSSWVQSISSSTSGSLSVLDIKVIFFPSL